MKRRHFALLLALGSFAVSPAVHGQMNPGRIPRLNPGRLQVGSASADPGPPPAPAGSTGKKRGDTSDLKAFEGGIEYEPRGPGYRVAFSLEDASLSDLVRVMSQLTGRRFIFGGRIREIKVTVYSPQKVSVAEAYQAFLAILETNGLTVVPHGRFWKIIETAGGAASHKTPVYGIGQTTTGEYRFVTRLHRLSHVGADELVPVLNKFKSKDAEIVPYAAGNLLIITDTGHNIRRLMHIIHDLDVGGVGDQIWIEPVHYMSATDMANRLNEVFDLKSAAGAKPGAAGGSSGGSDLRVTKIVADERSNSLIIVATERAYLRMLEFIKRLDQPHSGEGDIHVLMLQHAVAVDLAKTLQELVQGAQQPAAGAKPGQPSAIGHIFESAVKVAADKATNSLIITSSLRDYAALRSVIDKLDRPRRQVFIEAVIMELSVDRRNELGLSYHGGSAETTVGTGQSLIYGGYSTGLDKTLGLPVGALSGFALGVRGPTLPDVGLGLSIPAFGVLLSAIAKTNDADVLATPHIIATDGEDAEIRVGQDVPYNTNFPSFPALGAAGASAVPGGATSALGALGSLGMFGGMGMGMGGQRAKVGTKIKIKPTINDSNEVRLKITEEISEVVGEPVGTSGAIITAERYADTTLIAKDQQTVVIGGLMRNKVIKSQVKIPLLGDIPVLGALFRNNTDRVEKTDLVLVLTPHIIRSQEDLRKIFERKMQERQEFVNHHFVFSEHSNYRPPKDYSRAHGLLEAIRQSYVTLEAKRRLDAAQAPKALKTHEPSSPLALPTAVGRPGGAATPAVSTPAGTPRPPPINTTPPVRNLERIERK